MKNYISYKYSIYLAYMSVMGSPQINGLCAVLNI